MASAQFRTLPARQPTPLSSKLPLFSIGTIAGTIGVHKYAKLNDELVVQASERKIDREIESLRDTVKVLLVISKHRRSITRYFTNITV
jgi:hypothetical protein